MPIDQSTIHPSAPTSISSKLCGHCQKPFDDRGYMAKQYCSVRCRTAAKVRRAVQRDRVVGRVGARAPVAQVVVDEIVVVNPTIQQLEEYAKGLESGMITKPGIFRGMIPAWTSTQATVMFIQQFDGAKEKVPTEYIMGTEKIFGI